MFKIAGALAVIPLLPYLRPWLQQVRVDERMKPFYLCSQLSVLAQQLLERRAPRLVARALVEAARVDDLGGHRLLRGGHRRSLATSGPARRSSTNTNATSTGAGASTVSTSALSRV